ncbi:hypothetical protein EBX93_18880, partial [bacterium]|nr:hypothetical protein [bacterium]
MSKDSICPSSSGTFTATSSANASKWFWNFGDGSAVDSTGTIGGNITHTFPAKADTFYVIQHWVKTAAGCPSAILKDTIYIVHKPIANFLPPAGVCLPGTTIFINTSDTSKTNNGMPYTYFWSYGDGATGNTKDGSHGYTLPIDTSGYHVKLVATNKYGCVSDTAGRLIKNVYPKPVAIIGNNSDSTGCIDGFVNFIDSSSSFNSNLDSSFWFFFNDGIKYAYDLKAGGNSPTISYPANKTYQV